MRKTDYFGYTKKYLDSIECYLTYKGACETNACYDARDKWERDLHRKTLTAAEVVKHFQEQCVACWVNITWDNCIDEPLCLPAADEWDWELSICQLDSLCTCHCYQVLDWRQLKELTRWVKALIILLSNKRKNKK